MLNRRIVKSIIWEKVMKTYECIARSGNTGKQIVIFIRATSPGNAQMEALAQARQQFGNGAGAVTIVSVKKIR